MLSDHQKNPLWRGTEGDPGRGVCAKGEDFPSPSTRILVSPLAKAEMEPGRRLLMRDRRAPQSICITTRRQPSH